MTFRQLLHHMATRVEANPELLRVLHITAKGAFRLEIHFANEVRSFDIKPGTQQLAF